MNNHRSPRPARSLVIRLLLAGWMIASAATVAGCNPECDPGAVACSDNVAMNCLPAASEPDGPFVWQHTECGTSICVITDDPRPVAICVEGFDGLQPHEGYLSPDVDDATSADDIRTSTVEE